MGDGGKGSSRRPTQITDEQLEDAWNRIFSGHPNEHQEKIKDKDDTPTKPESTTSNKKNLQQTQKRRRVISRVVGRNRK